MIEVTYNIAGQRPMMLGPIAGRTPAEKQATALRKYFREKQRINVEKVTVHWMRSVEWMMSFK